MAAVMDDHELPVEKAHSLAQHRGDLSLNSCTALSAPAAAFLGQHKGGTLWLNGLRRRAGAPSGAAVP